MTTAEKLFQEGRAQGLEQGKRDMLLRQLRRRFGDPLPKEVLDQIEAADAGLLDSWGDRVLVAQSLAEVFAASAD